MLTGNNNNQYHPKALLHMVGVGLTILISSSLVWYIRL